MARCDGRDAARLFVAVDLDRDLRDRVRRTVRRLATAMGPDVGAHVRWVAPENLHVTLRFIGRVEPERAERMEAVVGAPIDEAPFRVRLAEAGTFPSRGEIRAIWLGVASGRDALAALQARVEASLRETGLEADERPFRAHLTLARCRRGCPGRAVPRIRDTLGSVGTVGTLEVDHVTLYESRLAADGPTYLVRAKGRLGARTRG